MGIGTAPMATHAHRPPAREAHVEEDESEEGELGNLLQRDAFVDQHDGNVFSYGIENFIVGPD